MRPKVNEILQVCEILYSLTYMIATAVPADTEAANQPYISIKGIYDWLSLLISLTVSEAEY